MVTLGTILVAITLGIDVFAGGLSLGVRGLNRDRWALTAVLFGVLTLVMTVIGLLLGRLLDEQLGRHASYVAGAVLVIVGLEAIIDTLFREHEEGDFLRELETHDIVKTGLMVTLDKLAIGVTLAFVDVPISGLVAYLVIQSFIATLIGLALGKRLGVKFGDAAKILAGSIFVILGAVIVIQTALDRGYV